MNACNKKKINTVYILLAMIWSIDIGLVTGILEIR